MSSKILSQVGNNYVHFDPSNTEHRRLAAIYVNTRSWKHTNTRFEVEFPYTNIITMITTKLAVYYANAEFNYIHDALV